MNKGCDCIIHDGPHWLHMDEIDWKASMRMLEEGNLRGYAVREDMRLRELVYQMKAHHIVETPEEVRERHRQMAAYIKERYGPEVAA